MTGPPPGAMMGAEDALREPMPDLDAVRAAATRSLLDRLVVGRVYLAPILGGVQLLTMALSPEPWRLAFGSVVLTGMLALFAVEYRRHRRGEGEPVGTLAYNLVGMGWIQVAVVVLTGGIHGPLFPILPMVAMMAALTFGPTLPLALIVGAHLTTLWALVAIELATGWSPALWGPSGASARWVVVLASTLTGMVTIASVVGVHVRNVVGKALADAVAAHDNERRAHAEHARELAALSGEIAHELKNPLASIHGLGALLARDLEGKPAERLGVLRGEVDRMRETLDTFLDFSRPLVPLAVGEVPLDELAREVLALCDGLARARGVTLHADDPPARATVRGDRRKLRQVLVNLVQNAIEAAPTGTRVEVVAGAGGFEVLDRGPGVAPEIAAHLFSPGATTRPRGSGLGLAIARGIVEQHGGTLVLEARPGGGTAARARLGVA